MDAQESQIYVSIIISVIILASLVCFFFFSTLRQHTKVRKLERENANAQVTALENDRTRIAADLHDDLTPMLAAVRMNINALDLAKETDKTLLLRTSETIDDIAKRMRTISFDLMPTTLQVKGLLPAIEEFVNYVSRSNALEISFSGPRRELNLDEQTTIHIYRIVQEIIHNTIKHARASKLAIHLKTGKGFLVLATTDNGIGFEHRQQLNNSKGLGLKSLMNRIYLLQAEFLIDREPGKGTSITIRIPQHD
jgi:signal transduction histidine kinase